MASETIAKDVQSMQPVDITSQCSITAGTIAYVRYLSIGHFTVIQTQVNSIPFSGTNIWLKLPDNFPGNATYFSPLATAYDGMLCVFRSQSGSGKYLLIQCSTNATLNLSASGVCLN